MKNWGKGIRNGFCLLVGLWGLSGFVEAGPQVRVEGLFKGAAVLNVDGQQVMLKNGKSHGSGVKLISATSRQAVVEVDGKQHTMGLHMAIGGSYQQTSLTQVVIKKNDRNQYKVNGSLNGMPVTFLVDTGATHIAINSNHAARLGIDFRVIGRAGAAETASGVVKLWHVTLNSVKVGEISLNQVAAVIN